MTTEFLLWLKMRQLYYKIIEGAGGIETKIN